MFVFIVCYSLIIVYPSWWVLYTVNQSLVFSIMSQILSNMVAESVPPMRSYKDPPVFSIHKPYDRYVVELEAWCITTSEPKNKQAVSIALSLPEGDPSGVRDKVFNEVTLAALNKDDGVTTLITYLDKLFKKDELSEVYERYTIFDRYERETNEKMDNFILEFERRYNRIKTKEMTLPVAVLAFKLLDAAKLPHRDRQFNGSRL